jgi:hypothetical protein
MENPSGGYLNGGIIDLHKCILNMQNFRDWLATEIRKQKQRLDPLHPEYGTEGFDLEFAKGRLQALCDCARALKGEI